jgi:hypothetical protein
MSMFCKKCEKIYRDDTLDCCPNCSGELFLVVQMYKNKEEFKQSSEWKPLWVKEIEILKERIEKLEKQIRNLDHLVYKSRMDNNG